MIRPIRGMILAATASQHKPGDDQADHVTRMPVAYGRHKPPPCFAPTRGWFEARSGRPCHGSPAVPGQAPACPEHHRAYRDAGAMHAAPDCGVRAAPAARHSAPRRPELHPPPAYAGRSACLAWLAGRLPVGVESYRAV
jgi:hypothetical protein